MKLGMPVIVVQVSQLNDSLQSGFPQIKRPFIIYARGWAGKNEELATSNSGQSEWGHQQICTQRGGGAYLIFYFCFIFKQILSVQLGLTVHGLQAF